MKVEARLICRDASEMKAHDAEAHLACTRARLARFGIDLRDDGTRGRCLVAAKDFKRGDLVLASAPFGLPVPVHAGSGRRCAGCFRDASDEAWEDGGERSPETCAGCGSVWFCSERCKACAMAGGHAAECAAARAYKKKYPGADATVSAEFCAVSALHRQCAKDNPEPAAPADETLPYLIPTTGDKADYGARHAAVSLGALGSSSDDIATWSRSHVARARAVGLVPESVTDAAAGAEIARSRVNDFFIQRWTGGDSEPIAAAVFPLGALLNHSCAPTCVASYRLDEAPEEDSETFPRWVQEFRCCADSVRAGEELTHAYVDAGDWANHRRAALLDRYGFVCDCARCPKDELGAPFDPPKPTRNGFAESGAADSPVSPDASSGAEFEARTARFEYCRESAWAALAMPSDTRARVTLEIAAKLLRDAECAEEVADERGLAEKAAGLLRGLDETLEKKNALESENSCANPYALAARTPRPTTPMRARALAMASNMAMFESDFEAALRLGEEHVACLVEGYGTRWHAKIAYELFKLGSVAGDGLARRDASAAKFREALEIGEVTLGEDSWVCRKAREYLGIASG